MNETTNSHEPVGVILPERIGSHYYLIVGQPLPADDRWLVVLAFSIVTGATDLVAHLIVPTPRDWYEVADESTPKNALNLTPPMLWLRALGLTLHLLRDKPSGRLTNSLVRSASTAPLERWARGFVAESRFFRGTGGLEATRPRGPVRGQREVRLVKVAAAYVALTRRPDVTDPVATLAAELSLARNTVSSYLFQCRHEYGLLTPSTRGVAGGALTPKGEALFAAITNEEATS